MNGRTTSILTSLIPHWAIFPVNNPKHGEDGRSLRSFLWETHLSNHFQPLTVVVQEESKVLKGEIDLTVTAEGMSLDLNDSSTSTMQRRKNACFSLDLCRWIREKYRSEADVFSREPDRAGEKHKEINGGLRKIQPWCDIARHWERESWIAVSEIKDSCKTTRPRARRTKFGYYRREDKWSVKVCEREEHRTRHVIEIGENEGFR